MARLLGAGRVGPAPPRARTARATGTGARIVDDIVQTVGNVHRLCLVIGRQDPDLARQIRRAISSVGLNSGEGLSARGGNRRVRLESAMASGREAVMGLRIAGAAGYLDAERVAVEVDTLDRIVATLYKLAYRAS
jgi:four helix bundle protein